MQAELLCPSEKQKLLMKREKNKKAAEKCRVKRKEESIKVRQEYDEYLDANESLQSEIRKLAQEKERLETILKEHNCVGAKVWISTQHQSSRTRHWHKQTTSIVICYVIIVC